MARVARYEGWLLVAYFFALRAETPYTVVPSALTPEDAIWVSRVAGLGFRWLDDGAWRVVARAPDFKRSEWPVPPFCDWDPLGSRFIVVTYDDAHGGDEIDRRGGSAAECMGCSRPGLAGAEYAERYVSRLIRSDVRSPRVVRAYREGDWLFIPTNGKWSPCRVARAHNGYVLGYVLGPTSTGVPDDLTGIESKTAGDAVWVGIVTDGGVLDGEWPVRTSTDEWMRSRWPMPAFRRSDPRFDTPLLVTYHPDDPGFTLDVRPVDASTTHGLPDDHLYAASELQLTLSREIARRIE